MLTGLSYGLFECPNNDKKKEKNWVGEHLMLCCSQLILPYIFHLFLFIRALSSRAKKKDKRKENLHGINKFTLRLSHLLRWHFHNINVSMHLCLDFQILDKKSNFLQLLFTIPHIQTHAHTHMETGS